MTVQKCKPFNGMVLLKPDPVEEKTGGIEIDDDAPKDSSTTGTIIKVSEEKNGVEYFSKEGMHVMYGGWAGTPLTVAGEQYLLMKDSDVLCEI